MAKTITVKDIRITYVFIDASTLTVKVGYEQLTPEGVLVKAGEEVFTMAANPSGHQIAKSYEAHVKNILRDVRKALLADIGETP